MTERDDLLRRVAGVDPYPSDQPLPSDISDSRPPVAILIQGGDDVDRVSPLKPARTTRRWRGPAVAVAALLVALLVAIPILLIDGSDDPVANTTAATVATTVPTTHDEAANAMLVTPAIGATWTLVATVNDWLTEPSLVDGELFAIRRGLDSNAKPNSEGNLEGMVAGFGGEDDGSPPDYWRSFDGVVWIRADDGGPPPQPSRDAAVAGASVSVERVISGGEGGTRVDNVVMATSSGAVPRAINLRPFQNDWMPRVMMGDLGWVVYSPPLEVGLAGNGSQAPRIGNRGLWYSPDTETWFEVTDRGPLVDNSGVEIVVRDDDILVFANTAEGIGWGIVSQLETEIWRLELSTDPTPAAQEATPSTTSPVAADDGAAPPDEAAELDWDLILATTKAKVVPAAAGCSAGSNPNAPGPVDQIRPQPASWTSNQSAVFDERTGHVIHVADNGETWALDVCTNTWTALNPAVDLQGLVVTPRPIQGELVYDVDSDVTLYIRGGLVLVYDAVANTWTAQPTPPKSYTINYPGLGAVYDPVSGLVVVQTGDHGLVAYDVDTNTWTEIGTLEGDYPGFLVGYSATTDRLYFLGFQSDGVAVDPRSGQTEPLDQPGVMGGWGAYEFATSTDTAYVYGDGVCRLDPTSLDWTCTGPPDIPREIQNFESMVADPINNRLLLIHGSCCGVYPTMHDDVWALDFDTGEWSLVLEEANQRVHR